MFLPSTGFRMLSSYWWILAFALFSAKGEAFSVEKSILWMLAFLLLSLYRILLTFWITSYKKMFLFQTLVNYSFAWPSQTDLQLCLWEYCFSLSTFPQGNGSPSMSHPTSHHPCSSPRSPYGAPRAASFWPHSASCQSWMALGSSAISPLCLNHYTCFISILLWAIGNPSPRKPSPTLQPHGFSSPHSDNPGLSGPAPCSVSPTGQRTLGGKDSAVLFTGQSPAFKNNYNTRQAWSEYLLWSHYSGFLSIFHMIISSWRTWFRYSPSLQTPN